MDSHIIVKLESYDGDNSSLSIDLWDDNGFTSREMWVIVAFDAKTGVVADVDYGYRSEKEAKTATRFWP